MRIQRKTTPVLVGILSALLGVLTYYNGAPESNTTSGGSKAPSPDIRVDPKIEVNPSIRSGDHYQEVSPKVDLYNSNEDASNAKRSDAYGSSAPKNSSQPNQEKSQKSSRNSVSSTSNPNGSLVQRRVDQNKPELKTVSAISQSPQSIAQAPIPANNPPQPSISQTIGNESNGGVLIGTGSDNTVTSKVKLEQNQHRTVTQGQNGLYVENGGNGANSYCGGTGTICGAGGSTFNLNSSQK